jgi:hypothetical protein
VGDDAEVPDHGLIGMGGRWPGVLAHGSRPVPLNRLAGGGRWWHAHPFG